MRAGPKISLEKLWKNQEKSGKNNPIHFSLNNAIFTVTKLYHGFKTSQKVNNSDILMETSDRAIYQAVMDAIAHVRTSTSTAEMILNLKIVFKSLVKSGYWVPNMVTKTLTG